MIEGKRTIWVFSPTSDWNMRPSELVVYSYMAYQDYYDNVPSKHQLSQVCGISREGIASSIEELEANGLIVDNRAVPAPEGILVLKKFDGGHWSKRYAGFISLVRSPSSEFTFLEVLLYSYVKHCIATNYTPSSGWTVSFLAKQLACDRSSIYRMLDKLNGRLLEYSTGDGLSIKAYKTVPDSLLGNFLDKGAFNPREAKGGMTEIEPPAHVPERVVPAKVVAPKESKPVDPVAVALTHINEVLIAYNVVPYDKMIETRQAIVGHALDTGFDVSLLRRLCEKHKFHPEGIVKGVIGAIDLALNSTPA